MPKQNEIHKQNLFQTPKSRILVEGSPESQNANVAMTSFTPNHTNRKFVIPKSLR